jgi:hypothetical protein
MAEDELRGTLFYDNFDEAILDALGADLLLPDRGDDFKGVARQVKVDGVEGTARDGRVIVGMDMPESTYNAQALPGINIRRTSEELDRNRMVGDISGKKYRLPDPGGSAVDVPGRGGEMVAVASHYRERRHAVPENINYDIEVRARYPREALRLLRFIRRRIHHRMYLPVADSHGDVSSFTIFLEGQANTSDVADVLDRYKSYIVSYRVEGQVDVYDEVTRAGIVRPPITRLTTHED